MHTQIARSWTAAQNLREVGRAIRSPYLPLVHSAVFTSNVVNRTPIDVSKKPFFFFFHRVKLSRTFSENYEDVVKMRFKIAFYYGQG